MQAVYNLSNLANRPYVPPLRHQPQFRFLEAVREERGGVGVHAFRFATFLFGADGVEVHEPRFEQGLGDGLECGVGFAEEGDAVVKTSEQFKHLVLLVQGWHCHFHRFRRANVEVLLNCAYCM